MRARKQIKHGPLTLSSQEDKRMRWCGGCRLTPLASRDPVVAKGGVSWATGDELAFLSQLGSWATTEKHYIARRSLLLRYLAAMPLRMRWGAIDAVTVRAAVEYMLRVEA